MRRIYVTGTDTGVGKSVVAACLAAGALAKGKRVVASKPVASGVAPGTDGEDAILLGLAAGHAPSTRFRFEEAVSPHRAARLEGVDVTVDELARFVDDLAGDEVIVEGAGGWRTPLGSACGLGDVARRRPGLVVVVAADRLGVLNHAILTVEAVRRDGLDVLGIVLNRGAAPADSSRSSNLEELRRLVDVPVAVLEPIDVGVAGARTEAGLALIEALR